MTRPRALDLFCKAGGASMGLHRAGFDVVGIDIEPQPNYPFTFIQGDALNPPVSLADFDFIWASPVCKRYSLATNSQGAGARERYPDQIGDVRELLARSGRLTCIENVSGAPLRPDLVLTGQMFGLRVIRRRVFELNFFALSPDRARSGRGLAKAGLVETVAGHLAGRKRYSVAMGIDWMTRDELAQAIPPEYAELIGRQALQTLVHRAAA